MRRKKVKNISVATVANGYVLKYEGMRGHSGFMYFNPQELTAGLLRHVVLGVKDEQNKVMCECLLQSMATWSTVGEMHEATAELMKEARDADERATAARRMYAAAEKRIEELSDEIAKLKRKNAEYYTELFKYRNINQETEMQRKRHEANAALYQQKYYKRKKSKKDEDTR